MPFAGNQLLLELVSATSPPVYPQAVTLAVFELILFIINLPAFVWHVSRKNVAISSIVFWVEMSCLIHFINALLWKNDDIVHWWEGYGYCDIAAKLDLGAEVGVCGSVASAMRALAKVMDTNKPPVPTKAQRQRDMAFDLFFCYGVSMFTMVIHYIVQPYRFNVLGIEGCNPAVDSSWPSIPLLGIEPTLLILVATFYSVVLFIRLVRYRSQISGILRNSNTSKNRFFRLFILTGILTLALLPSTIYTMYTNVSSPLQPYDWDAIHGPEFQQVRPLPSFGQVPPGRWVQIGFTTIMFFFLGTGSDMTKMYKGWLIAIGLARIFPSLTRAKARNTSGDSQTSLLKSIAQKAMAILQKQGKSDTISSGVIADSTGSVAVGCNRHALCARCQNPVLCIKCQNQADSFTNESETTAVDSSIGVRKEIWISLDEEKDGHVEEA